MLHLLLRALLEVYLVVVVVQRALLVDIKVLMVHDEDFMY
jgi:hypothetical protein